MIVWPSYKEEKLTTHILDPRNTKQTLCGIRHWSVCEIYEGVKLINVDTLQVTMNGQLPEYWEYNGSRVDCDSCILLAMDSGNIYSSEYDYNKIYTYRVI